MSANTLTTSELEAWTGQGSRVTGTMTREQYMRREAGLVHVVRSEKTRYMDFGDGGGLGD